MGLWRWLRQRFRTVVLRILGSRILRVGWPVLQVLAALAVLFFGLWLLRDSIHGKSVEGAFTRVGGPTRVETALEASRFWLAPPASVVVVGSHEPPETVWGAARCALRLDAPLLFAPPNHSSRWRLFAGAIRRLGKDPSTGEDLKPGSFSVLHDNRPATVGKCSKMSRSTHAAGLSRFAPSAPLQLPLPEVDPGTSLKPVVVFAAAKAPSDAPDVAVGVALAGHLATARHEVSLVVVPRYLQADRDLEDQLRDQRDAVESGVLLGQSGILSGDTQSLLRQIIRARDTSGILGAARTDVDAVKAVVAALLAALGFGTAARAAPEAGKQLAESLPERVRKPVRTTYEMARERTGLDRGPTLDAWIRGLDRRRPVTVWLRSGRAISEVFVDAKSSAGVLRLHRANAGGREHGEGDPILVRLEDVQLIEAGPSAAIAPSAIRQAGIRLAAELVARLSGQQLPALERYAVTSAIRSASSQQPRPVARNDPLLTDLRRLLADAAKADDHDLHSALYAVDDGLRLAERHPNDKVASQALWDAIDELARVASRAGGSN